MTDIISFETLQIQNELNKAEEAFNLALEVNENEVRDLIYGAQQVNVAMTCTNVECSYISNNPLVYDPYNFIID